MVKGSIVCFIFCFGFSDLTPSAGTEVPLDSFCSAYTKVLETDAEIEPLTKLPLAAQTRIQRNEILFRCRCENWKSPLCKPLEEAD